MERILNVTEARNQLVALVQEVAEKDNQIVISTWNQPKAIIMGYNLFLNQQKLSTKGAEYRLRELIEQAQLLLETTLEGCGVSGDSKLYLFWRHFGQLMRDAWEISATFSEPHGLICFQLFEFSERCLAGYTMLAIEQLQPLSDVLTRLMDSELTLEDAAEVDRTLLQNGIDATFPMHIAGDLNALYEIDKDEIGENVDDSIDEIKSL